MAGYGRVRQGSAGYGRVRHGKVGCGRVRQGAAGYLLFSCDIIIIMQVIRLN